MVNIRWIRIPITALVLLTLALGALGAGVPVAQAGNYDEEYEREDPRSVPVKTLEEALKTGRISKESVVAARKDGLAAIVIKLRLPAAFQAEGTLANSQVEEQRQAIADKQRSVLTKIDGLDFADVKQYETIPWMAMWADTKTLTALVTHPDVFRILPDRVSDFHLSQSVRLIGGDVVHRSLGNSGAGQTIAILDTGVDRNHPFLAGKVVSEGCFSTSMPFSSSNVCPGGSDSTQAGSGAPCTLAGCGHGTHVAGIAAGDGSRVLGAAPEAGVAPQANIISIQVASDFGGKPSARSSDILEGLERVYDLRHTFNIGAVNLSAGSGYYTNQATCDDENEDYKDLIDNLRAAGIPTVASSGNGAFPFQDTGVGIDAPACISSAISVGATMGGESNESVGVWPRLGSASQTASFLDLLAPGTFIESSIPGTLFVYMTGTSFAAPHVAGAFAVLRGLDPSASVGSLLNTLATTGVPITDSRPAQSITTPRIQLNAAVEALTQRPLPPTFTPEVVGGGTFIQAGWMDNSLTEVSFTLTATPQSVLLLPDRHTTVGANQTTAIVGSGIAKDGSVLKLEPDTIYTLTVRACNSAGNCADSQPLTQRTANTLPAEATNLRTTNVTSSGVTLEWDYAGAHPVTHFWLVRYVCGPGYDCDPTTPAIQIGGGERTYDVTGLVGNWSVRWRIQACNSDGCSGWENGPARDVPSPGSAPATPTNLHVCGQGQSGAGGVGVALPEACVINQITLFWNDNANNEDSYEFQWSIAQPGTAPWNAAWSTASLGQNRDSYALSSWISDTIYYFRVRACNVYGCSSWSNMVSYSTP